MLFLAICLGSLVYLIISDNYSKPKVSNDWFFSILIALFIVNVVICVGFLTGAVIQSDKITKLDVLVKNDMRIAQSAQGSASLRLAKYLQDQNKEVTGQDIATAEEYSFLLTYIDNEDQEAFRLVKDFFTKKGKVTKLEDEKDKLCKELRERETSRLLYIWVPSLSDDFNELCDNY